MNKTHLTTASLILVSSLFTFTGIAASTPILEFKFDDTGTTTRSTGSNTSSLTFYNSSSTATDLHGSGATLGGPSGLAGDFTFNNTATSARTGGRAAVNMTNAPSIATDLNNLKSMTIQGWLKTESIGDGARILDFGGTNGVTLQTTTSGNLQLYVNGSNTAVSGYSATGVWIFFAVTYDAEAKRALFYVGGTGTDAASQVSLAGTKTFDAGVISSSGAAGLGVGGLWNSNIRSYDGLIDNLRIYGSAADASGALSLGELQTLRNADLAIVPEASASAALAGLTGLLAAIAGHVFIHRRRS
ncbi:LamG-like jellyroll fold domain-containing protein [Geminisphaera colitermitum]|uniref:LamG-like jellyroll fold domain-containing protein n=1 Tax=Geminisphaera colitermitum TaxID=1148786 RepID=UPI0001964E00|nr:LamG-like jellyroll fold domain-containing protein [Geminisphaera colitermitum]